MKCLNGLRVLSMVWIVWGHTYNYIGDQSFFLLTQNALDLLEFQKRLDAQIVINALYGVDTFFLISAMLVTLSILRMLKKSGMPRWYFWPMMYLERYLRLVPPYIMIFLLYIYVTPYIGQGPLWSTKDFPMQNSDCHNYWWAYFLLINNFVPNGRGTRCLGYYWYVSNDFQLFLIAPFLIVPLYYYPLIGSFILFGVLVASSCILGFNIANTYIVGNILVTLKAIWEGKRKIQYKNK
jgi:peptidoglycan/LPS O-acetylase OafA/YrhL